MELGDVYLDWFFLHYFGKGPGYWRGLPDEQMIAMITLEQEKEKQYWENMKKILGGSNG